MSCRLLWGGGDIVGDSCNLQLFTVGKRCVKQKSIMLQNWKRYIIVDYLLYLSTLVKVVSVYFLSI